MVVELIVGVVKLVPVPSDEPPDDAANQLIVAPEVAVAPSVTVPDGEQIDAGVVEVIAGLVTVIVATEDGTLLHPALDTTH